MPEIPLLDRTGAVVAHALVDEEDFALVSQYRWRLFKKRHLRYAARGHRTVFMHTEILRPEQGMEVDHVSGDGLDNRRRNLRPTTHAQNMQNRAKRPGYTSALRGVYQDKKTGRWRGSLHVNGRSIQGPRRATEAEAAADAAALRQKYYTHAVEGRDETWTA